MRNFSFFLKYCKWMNSWLKYSYHRNAVFMVWCFLNYLFLAIFLIGFLLANSPRRLNMTLDVSFNHAKERFTEWRNNKFTLVGYVGMPKPLNCCIETLWHWRVNQLHCCWTWVWNFICQGLFSFLRHKVSRSLIGGCCQFIQRSIPPFHLSHGDMGLVRLLFGVGSIFCLINYYRV